MVNIKNYGQYILERVENNKTLYHASLYNFDKFKNRTTFFTDDKNFAIEYAQQKGMDMQIDNDIILYTVSFSGKLFDINNEQDYKLLERKLPSKVSVSMASMPMSYDMDKDDLLLNMRGYDKIEPIDNIKDLKVGDTFPNPEYTREDLVVYEITDEYLRAYSESRFKEVVENFYKDDTRSKIYDIFEPLKKFIDNWIENNTDIRYVREHIRYDFLQKFLGKDNPYGTVDVEIDKESKEKFMKLYNNAINNVKDKMANHKLILEEKIIKVEDTWTFFENDTVINIIKKLGYDGYIALERGIKTYAIFNPNKTVKIIKSE